MKDISWTELKTAVDSQEMRVKYVDTGARYFIWAFDGDFYLQTDILKTDAPSEDQLDFEDNYKANANKKLVPDTDSYSNTDQFKAACIGFTGTATAGETTNIDYTLSDTRYLIGVSIILKNQIFGDKISFQVVHPSYGVLSEFASDWNVSADAQNQGKFDFPLRGKIPAGLKIRLVYISTGETDVLAACNLIMHKKA